MSELFSCSSALRNFPIRNNIENIRRLHSHGSVLLSVLHCRPRARRRRKCLAHAAAGPPPRHGRLHSHRSGLHCRPRGDVSSFCCLYQRKKKSYLFVRIANWASQASPGTQYFTSHDTHSQKSRGAAHRLCRRSSRAQTVSSDDEKTPKNEKSIPPPSKKPAPRPFLRRARRGILCNLNRNFLHRCAWSREGV